MTAPAPSRQLSVTQVLCCGALIVTLSMGIRHGFGLWLAPITMDRGWTRETFAFALAIQNLAWGLAAPFAGMLADRWGAFRVLVLGSVLYSAGLVLMALSTSGLAFASSAGLLIGLAQSGTTYAVVYGVIGRQIEPERRTWAMGVAAAAGSFGQFLMVPVENWLIQSLNWQNALFLMGCLVLAIAPLAIGLREPPSQATVAGGERQSIAQALREALSYPSFHLLMVGYFVCGFQVVFIGVHMPSFLKDKGLSPDVATTALGIISLFNVLGTYAAGVLGQRWPKRHLLSLIYLTRSIAIALFLWAPLSPSSVYIFSAVMGALWLSTVPLTSGVVAQIFGVQYLSMLAGFVFVSHQIGSFLGVWMGGKLFDATGSYNVVWWISIGLGIIAAVANQPIQERAIVRPQLQRA
ncbi:MAG: MFS transporter [Burkholderiales bacterium]